MNLPDRVSVLTALFSLLFSHHMLGQSESEKITDATLPIPPHLQDGATVYDMMSTPPSIIRQGSNGIVCLSDSPDPGYEVTCLDESWLPYMRRFASLQAEGASMLETHKTINAELANGLLPSPDIGAIGNVVSGPSKENLNFLTSIFMGTSGTAETGLPVHENQGTWLMCAGTPQAHIMIGQRPNSVRNEKIADLCGLDE